MFLLHYHIFNSTQLKNKMGFKSFFRGIGRGIKKGFNTVGSGINKGIHGVGSAVKFVGRQVKNTVEIAKNTVSTVYKDVKSVGSFAGKQTAKVVDTGSSALKSLTGPFGLAAIGIGGLVAYTVISKKS